MTQQRKNRLGLWLIVVGPGIWATHFLACYVVAAILCEKSGAAASGLLKAAIAALTLGALGALAPVIWRTWRQWGFQEHGLGTHDEGTGEVRYRFLGHAAFLLAALSVLGVIYTALPAALVPELCQ